MNLSDLLASVEARPAPVLGYFLALPAVAWLAGRFHPRGTVFQSPVRWVYSAVLYGAAIPGIVAGVALADTLAHERLMQAGVLSQLLPLLSMLITVGIIRRQAAPEHIPGFSQMTGFLLLLVFTAVGVFLLMQIRIWIFIGGGMWTLLISMTVLFLLLKWAFERTFGRSR
jgi:hypothetical protein